MSDNRSEYIGAYEHDDGCNGHKRIAHMVLYRNKVLAVYTFCTGLRTGLSMDVIDVAEAKWLIANHPYVSGRYRPIA